MKILKQAVLALGAAAAVGASATSSAQMAGDAQTGWYAGGSIGKSRDLDSCDGGFGGTCSSTDTAYRLFGGYQVNRYLALELGYHELGEVVAEIAPFRQTIETTAYDLVAVGMLPLWEKVSLSGKLGVYYADTGFTSTPAIPGATTGTSNTGLTIGVGAQFEATRNLGLRLEWQQFIGVSIGAGLGFDRDIEVLSLGALWRFR